MTGKGKLLIPGLVLLAVAATPPWVLAQDSESHPNHQRTWHHRHGYLGVELHRLTPELQRHFGVPSEAGLLVAAVRPHSPAAEAGIDVGDVLTAIDGQDVQTVSEVRRALAKRTGGTVQLEIYRNGRQRELTVRLEERHGRGRAPFPAFDETDFEELGERLAELGDELGNLGDDLGEQISEALETVDWEDLGDGIERALEGSLGAVDWEALGYAIERSIAETLGALALGDILEDAIQWGIEHDMLGHRQGMHEHDYDMMEHERDMEELERDMEELDGTLDGGV